MLSTTVADQFATLRSLGESFENTEATETFCRMFDKFFDIWNTRALEESDKKLKPNLKPFYYDFDRRLDVRYKNLMWLLCTLFL